MGGGADSLDREGVELVGGGEHFGDDPLFVLAEGVDGDVAGCVDAVEGEGEPIGVLLRDVVCGDKPLDDVEGLGVGEEGGCMPIFTDAERDQVEGGGAGGGSGSLARTLLLLRWDSLLLSFGGYAL